MCADASQVLMRSVFNTHAEQNIRYIDALEIRSNTADWKDTASHIVFSGGAVTGFKQALHKNGLSQIREFVEQGGIYVGFCAGAYFGASSIEFKGYDWQSKSAYERSGEGLSFFNGLARGSLGRIAPLYDGTSATCRATPVTLDYKGRITRDLPPVISAFYGGGPEFLIDNNAYLGEQNTRPEIISHYILSDGTQRVAGLSCPIGDKGGKAVLISWHPDLNEDYLTHQCQTRFTDPGDNRQKIADDMRLFNRTQNKTIPWLRKHLTI